MALPRVDDALRKIAPLAWRGISFPLANLTTSFAQSIAQHEKPDRDGAKLEATGRKAVVVSGTALFYNGIVFDFSANTDQPLFPDVHREFLLACADRTTGELLHPVLGLIDAKCASFTSSVEAGRRDGARVDVSWVQHTDDAAVLGEPSPLAFADVSARLLDFEIAKHPSMTGTFPDSFAKLVFQLQAFSDSASFFSRRVAGLIPSMVRQATLAEQAFAALGTALGHVGRELAIALRAALLSFESAASATATVLVYVARIDTTLGAIAAELGVPTATLATLNPQLVGSARVPRGSVVRYATRKP